MENSQLHSIKTKIDNTNIPIVLIAILSITRNNIGYKEFLGGERGCVCRVMVRKECDIQVRFLVRNDSKK